MVIGAVLNTDSGPDLYLRVPLGRRSSYPRPSPLQIISAVVLTVYFMRYSNMRLKTANFRLSSPICGRMIALGVSSGITQSAATILQVVLNNSLVFYGNRTAIGGRSPKRHGNRIQNQYDPVIRSVSGSVSDPSRSLALTEGPTIPAGSVKLTCTPSRPPLRHP